MDLKLSCFINSRNVSWIFLSRFLFEISILCESLALTEKPTVTAAIVTFHLRKLLVEYAKRPRTTGDEPCRNYNTPYNAIEIKIGATNLGNLLLISHTSRERFIFFNISLPDLNYNIVLTVILFDSFTCC